MTAQRRRPTDELNACVPIRYKFRDGSFGYATGFFVSPNALVTARHAIDAPDIVAGSHEIGSPPDGAFGKGRSAIRIAGKPLWMPAKGSPIDLAVVPTSQATDVTPIACDLFNRVNAGAAWSTRGFPAHRSEDSSTRSKADQSGGAALDIGGTLAAGRASDGSLLRATVENPPKKRKANGTAKGLRPFGGMSGAPILVQGRAVGVVIEGDGSQEDNEIVGVSFGAVADEADFLTALGLAQESNPRQMDGIVATLRHAYDDETLGAAAAKLLEACEAEVPRELKAKFERLVRVHGRSLLVAVQKELIGTRSPRSKAASPARRLALCQRSIAYELLPWLVAKSPAHLVYSEGVAEVVAAGAAKRRVDVRVDKRGELCFPWRAPVPAETGIDCERAYLDALLVALNKQLGLGLKGDLTNWAKLINVRLRNLHAIEDPERRPLYAVVEHTPTEALATRVIKKYFPSLLLVNVDRAASGDVPDYHLEIEDLIRLIVAE